MFTTERLLGAHMGVIYSHMGARSLMCEHIAHVFGRSSVNISHTSGLNCEYVTHIFGHSYVNVSDTSSREHSYEYPHLYSGGLSFICVLQCVAVCVAVCCSVSCVCCSVVAPRLHPDSRGSVRDDVFGYICLNLLMSICSWLIHLREWTNTKNTPKLLYRCFFAVSLRLFPCASLPPCRAIVIDLSNYVNYSYVWNNPFMCVIWLIHMNYSVCDMTLIHGCGRT